MVNGVEGCLSVLVSLAACYVAVVLSVFVDGAWIRPRLDPRVGIKWDLIVTEICGSRSWAVQGYLRFICNCIECLSSFSDSMLL